MYNDYVIYNSLSTSLPNLAAASLKDMGTIEMFPNVGTNYIVCQGEYTYFRNTLQDYGSDTDGLGSDKIERIRNSVYIRGEKTIHMLSSLYSAYTPFGCGYIIEREYPTEEDFALALLSHDDSFDISLMSSRDRMSLNIKNKGSFYPLNKVDGVMDYLDACFPYIKKAATSSDGEIWMLPITISIPTIIYNEKLCKEKGIDLSASMDFTGFAKSFSDFKDNYDPKYSCGLSAYIVTEYIFNQYLRENDDFNNELFYNIAKQLKENFNYIDDEWAFYTSSSVHYMLLNGITDNFLFNNEYYLDRQYNYLIKNDLRISPIPYKSNDNKYAATCIYLCVNPYSKNLKETLKFVSSLSKYLIQLNNTMMFSNRELYPESHGFDDLYDILSNSEIIFSIPDEILLDEYDRYVLDEIDIENFANEVDRKVKTYLGE